ncbi:MAG: SDR family oxidoreductase [Planctomycetota bacterium]|jgi:uncharacterized protein YbjT (DUF2867 family)
MKEPADQEPSPLKLAWDEELFCADLASKPRPEIGPVLVTGASGYIGGRLVPELLARGYRVRLLIRAPSPEYESVHPNAETLVGDVLNPEDLDRALEGVHTAYYLVHSLVRGPKDFEEADLKAAANFRTVADSKQLQRIIYLGGVGAAWEKLSDHLRSRLEVSEELKRGLVPVTSLHAAVIIGSGSASYEIIQHLVKNLPFLLIPKWAKNRCQPIAIRDVIKYLVGALEVPEVTGLTLEIGGKDVLTYEQMMREFVKIMQRKRLFIYSPISYIGIYSYVASLITPVPAPITQCLMEGLVSDAICKDDSVRRYIPFEPLSYREAIVRAMSREEQDRVSTRWSDAYPPAHELAIKFHELEEPPRFKAAYSKVTDRPCADLFKAYCKMGGKIGWLHFTWMWRLRGAIDRIFFGVGTARGRRSSKKLKINDVIDFWRVEDIKQDERLLLRAEMKVPGKAWLEFTSKEEDGQSRLSIAAHFDTRGLYGKCYWYFFMPFHDLIFKSMLKEIIKRAGQGE